MKRICAAIIYDTDRHIETDIGHLLSNGVAFILYGYDINNLPFIFIICNQIT